MIHAENMIRLDKFLADEHIASRSQIKQYCKKGMVTVDGTVCKDADRKIDPALHTVAFGGKTIRRTANETVCYMLNKPAGFLSVTSDLRDETVFSLLKELDPERFFPVGRLDKDSEGLLLITNDGALSHALTSPRRHVSKTYEVRITGILSQEEIDNLQRGTDIGDDTPTLPAIVEIREIWDAYTLSTEEKRKLPSDTPDTVTASRVRITIREGRYHQVKRMFHANRHEVFFLKRLSIGSLALDDSLRPGEYRRLTAEEREALFS